jgi:heme exporter protein C
MTDSAARRVVLMGAATAILIGTSIIGLFLVAPEDNGPSGEGVIQRIFYFHVSIALVSLVAFGVAFLAGAAYLRRPRDWFDDVVLISVRLGLLFAVLTVVTGSIWAKAAWGRWWIWSDPRLATYTLVILLYAAYFVLRSSADGPRQARFSAVYAIVAFISVPISFYAVRIAQSVVHPVVFTSKGAAMPHSMLVWFVVALAGIIMLFFTLLQLELIQQRTHRALQEVKLRLERG